MELLLLWLDEIDDLVFAGFSLWLRVCRLSLSIALIAVLALKLLPGIATG